MFSQQIESNLRIKNSIYSLKKGEKGLNFLFTEKYIPKEIILSKIEQRSILNENDIEKLIEEEEIENKIQKESEYDDFGNLIQKDEQNDQNLSSSEEEVEFNKDDDYLKNFDDDDDDDNNDENNDDKEGSY
jgi:hypothetical protein